MANCSTCDKTPYTSFNWAYAREGKDREMAALAGHLEECRALKFGVLYRCVECGLLWFLDDHGFCMYRVRPEKKRWLFAWAECELVPDQGMISRCQEIGATGPDQPEDGENEVEIPCAIETESGTLQDRALVLFTKMPPIAEWQKSVTLGNAVTSILASDLALPLDVRLEAMNADEISMGFAPTCVQANDGRCFVLNGSSHFFSHGPLKGKDISLCPVPFDVKSGIPIVAESADDIHYVFFDWFPGCESFIRTSGTVS